MSHVDQREQAPTGAQFEQEGVESIKVERNSRGYNYSFRVVLGRGEDWMDAIRRARIIDGQLAREFGRD